MQFPESWLREYCDPALSTAQLAELLTMSGMEVEELRPVAPPFTHVVVGHVLSVQRHPNADRLNVCEVDVGAAAPLQIVCGAPNVAVGLNVPCALVGAELPPAEAGGEPLRIKLGQLRGVESQGMLCSARELKLSDDAGGLLVLAADAAPGRDLRDLLSLDDTLFTLKLTPNLGHGLSIYGVAREVAALTGAPLKPLDFPPVQPAVDDRLAVRIEATDLCGRFSGRIVRGVDPTATTPAWMVDRLARCGQRSVTALVDISNYVMFELGRPSHIFDLERLQGGLTVRWGRAGETLALLNGTTIEIDAKVGVIADDVQVESLAGIMGGQATAVSDVTRDVYVEAAFWWPESVAGRSRRYGFSTDAGHRFERGVDPATTVEHLERITALILQICGGQAGPVDDQTLRLPARAPVTMRVARAAKVIGMPVTQEQCAGVFTRLGFGFEQSPGEIRVTPPSWRFDLAIEEDLIEEVARVIGYQQLPDTAPLAPVTARALTESRRSSHAVRRAVAALDYQETINYSFVEERWEHDLAGHAEPIRLLNPIASPLSVMRSSLIGGLIAVLRYNLARRATRVRIFEYGRVFRRDASVATTGTTVAGVDQPLRVGGLAYGPVDPTQWGRAERAVDFYDVKGDVQALLAPREARFVPDTHPAMHPGRCARVEVDGEAVGHVGELHPRWRQAYELPGNAVVFELTAQVLLERPVPVARALPRLQSVGRDLALIVGEAVSHDALIAAATAAGAPLLQSCTVFDIYRPAPGAAGFAPGERSMALRLALRDDTTTLTDERIDATVKAIVDDLSARLGARLRG